MGPALHPFTLLPFWVSSSSVPARSGGHWGPACSGSGCPHSFSPKTSPQYSVSPGFSFPPGSSPGSSSPSEWKQNNRTSLLGSDLVWSGREERSERWAGTGRVEGGREGGVRGRGSGPAGEREEEQAEEEEGAQWCCHGSSCHQCLSGALVGARTAASSHTHYTGRGYSLYDNNKSWYIWFNKNNKKDKKKMLYVCNTQEYSKWFLWCYSTSS